MAGSLVRRSAVAGAFYPSDSRRLRADIERYLNSVPDILLGGRPVAVIEPHAGYIYSGQIAAYGYRVLANRGIRTVVVISPSHMEHFPFASVFEGEAYETPLGAVPVDTELAQNLVDGAAIRLSGRGHVQADFPRREHALEVQLPFLQVLLDDFRVVPIVMGEQSWETCERLGLALRPHMARSDLLIVASSDLSHFHESEVARKKDALFCEMLERMNPVELYDAVASNKCEACGAGPIVATLMATQSLGEVSCRVLKTASSGDITGDRNSVVGYAAAVIVAKSEDKPVDLLGQRERRYLLRLARHRIRASLGLPSDPPVPDDDYLNPPCGAFVTLKVGDKLRGCIGNIHSDLPLHDTVARMAEAAALHDPRFPPLDGDELADVRIEISALSTPRRIRGAHDIRVGEHGLIVEKDHTRGLLLPQVAAERNWDVETFLSQTCVKAGLPPNAWRDPDTQIFVFTATIFSEDT